MDLVVTKNLAEANDLVFHEYRNYRVAYDYIAHSSYK